MEPLNNICCFCLCPNALLTDIFIKDNEGVTNFDRIDSSLFKLAKILNKNSNFNYQLCYKCCGTLEMVHKFNQSCLHNVEKYLSQMKTRIGTKEQNEIFELSDDRNSKTSANNQFIKIETYSDSSCNNDNPKSNVEEVVVKPEIEVISDIAVLENFPHFLTMETTKIEGKRARARTNAHTFINMLEVDENLRESGQYSEFLLALDQDEHRKFTCEYCDRDFISKHNYERHLQTIHRELKPFKCGICQHLFGRKDHLRDHILLHTTEKSHKCEVCEKSFYRKSNLETHKLIHSGYKPFSCDQCDKKFFQKGSLVKHKRSHSGEKPFKCEICGVGFNDKSYLRIHHRVHTGEKPISCNICDKKFRKKSDFNRHKRVHNK